jgi:cytochrome c5
VATAPAEPAAGEQIYQRNCLACHTTGAAGAPPLGDAAAWAPRIAQGMDTLMANATNGLNAMPPKGLCMTCSADELKSAVDYIINNSQ